MPEQEHEIVLEGEPKYDAGTDPQTHTEDEVKVKAKGHATEPGEKVGGPISMDMY